LLVTTTKENKLSYTEQIQTSYITVVESKLDVLGADVIRLALKVTRGLLYTVTLGIVASVSLFAPLWLALVVAVPAIWYLYIVTVGTSAGLSYLNEIEENENA